MDDHRPPPWIRERRTAGRADPTATTTRGPAHVIVSGPAPLSRPSPGVGGPTSWDLHSVRRRGRTLVSVELRRHHAFRHGAERLSGVGLARCSLRYLVDRSDAS